MTARNKLEERLRQSQKMESIGTLAGGIAHDFNNILASVIGFTELSLQEVEPGTILEDNLQEVYAAGKRAKELVKQILIFTRQTDEEQKPIQVDVIAKETLKLMRATIPKTIEIDQRIESKSLIIGNPTQIHPIFMNLCANAAHAMEEKGGILGVFVRDVFLDSKSTENLEGIQPGDFLEISVTDTGNGISPGAIGSIFDPYFTTKRPGEGTGMGLATVHGIVKSHGGDILAESSPGRGTRIKVYIPVTKKRVQSAVYNKKE